MHDIPDLDRMATECLSGYRGLCIAGISQDGRQAYGYAADTDQRSDELRRERGQPVMEIGSLSKLFTGLLLAQAVERGDLAIDRPLSTSLPDGVKVNARVGAITLRQLITHTSCLPSLPTDFDVSEVPGNPYRDYSRERLWRALGQVTIAHSPPCEYQYSNWGVAVVAEILSQRYGRPWAALVAERIALPLGLRETAGVAALSAALEPGYNGQDSAEPWTFQAFAGAGAMRSTAADMLAFGRALLAGKSGPLGAAAERFLNPLASDLGGQSGYAIRMHGNGASRVYFHDGQTGGFRAEFALIPGSGEVIVLLASNAQAPVANVALELQARRFPVDDGSANVVVTAKQLAQFQGVYRINDKLALTFVAQDGVLYGRLSGQVFSALVPIGGDAFTLPRVGAEFVFSHDGVTLRQNGGVLIGARTAEKAPPRAHLDPSAAQAYAGAFSGQSGTGAPLAFRVQATGGQLAVQLAGQPVLPVFEIPGRPDRFRYDVVQAEIQFERGADGSVTGLVLHQGGEVRATRNSAPVGEGD